MPVFNSIELLEQLKSDVVSIISQYEHIVALPEDILLQQPSADKWSIAQILEHLNGYNRFYLPVMEQAVKDSSFRSSSFKTGLIGNYFTKIMLPKETGVTNKMKAPKDYSYTPDLDIKRVLNEFSDGQTKLLSLLEDAKGIDLGKAKIPISISRFVKLRLGDGFRFLIAHQQRHFVQIENVQRETSVITR